MIAGDTVPVVWVAPGAPGGAAPGADAARALEAWARGRGIVLTAPAEGASPSRSIPWGAGDEAERALGQAREALVALDADASDRALARAEAAVRAAPELPHAPWLMAEVQRGWAARFTRVEPRDPERAARAWQRASALDGGRVPGIGEAAAEGVEPDASVSLVLDGEGRLEARVDGAPAPPGPVARTIGEHHVAVTRLGALVWAGWVAFAPGAVVRIAVPSAPACGASDLAHAAGGADGIDARLVRCPRWIAASTVTGAPPGSLRVATCSGARCERFERWPQEPRGPLADAPRDAAPGRWPAWATWTLVGAGVAALTTGTVLVASGTFRTPPPETRFVSGGVRVNALPLPF